MLSAPIAAQQDESVCIFCEFGQSGDKIVPVDSVEVYRFFSLPRSITRCIPPGASRRANLTRKGYAHVPSKYTHHVRQLPPLPIPNPYTSAIFYCGEWVQDVVVFQRLSEILRCVTLWLTYQPGKFL